MKYENNARVTIEQASNGVVVCAYAGTSPEEKKYIYKSLEAALKAIPSIMSVAEAEKPEDTEKDMENMKADIGKEDD